MQRKIIWLIAPVVFGVLIAALALALPAQAGSALANAQSDSPGDETHGILESFPEGLIGSWTVSGTVYTATSSTHFSMDDGAFYVGACVEVHFDPATYFAYAIEMENSDDCGEDDDAREHFIGLIEQVPTGYTGTMRHSPGISGTWVISGVNFLSTLQTRLKTEHGPLAVGACARVKYRLVDGANIADEIRSEKIYKCYQPAFFNQAYGYVVTYPDDLSGAWLISDTAGMSLTFMTTPSSRVSTRHYPLEIGACVKVKYFNDQGVNIASKVETKNPHHCQGHFIDDDRLSKIYALVEAMPPTGTITGTWTFAGVNFTATQQTHIDDEEDEDDDEENPLAVGNCAEAKYDPASGAMLLYKVEGEETDDCQADDGSPQFKLYGVVEMMPGAGYTGTWQVSGVTFSVTPSTTLNANHGDFATGAYVKVYFTYDPATGERTAVMLKTHVAPGYGWETYRGRFGGWSQGSIILDGSPLAADANIEIAAGVTPGALVWVNAYQDAGSVFVTRILADQTVYLPAIHR